MRQMMSFLIRPLSTTRFDEKACQFLCYAAALLVLAFGFLAVGRLDLDEAHLFLGLLLILVVAMLGVVLGTLSGPAKKAT